MSPRYLTEADVTATLTVADAIELLEAAARENAEGKAENKPRQRAFGPGVVLQVLPAAYSGFVGYKAYVVAKRGPRFWHHLYAASGEWLAIIEADALGQMRTGAASGIATRALARRDVTEGAVIGTGWQARSQLEAICIARPLRRVRAYGRNRERLDAFCSEMSAKTGVAVEPAASAREAVDGAGVVCTMTSATTPVLEGAWLAPGTHVNAAGSNRPNAQEIDVECVRRAAVVAVEDLAQAKVESGDLRAANEAGAWRWEEATRLADIIAGAALGRTADDQITLFESLGIGLWDLAAAIHVYERAVVEDRGTTLSIPS